MKPQLVFVTAELARSRRRRGGGAVRFEPGQTRRVALVPVGGRRVIIGFAGLVDGPLDAPGARERALERARACGYADTGPGAS